MYIYVTQAQMASQSPEVGIPEIGRSIPSSGFSRNQNFLIASVFGVTCLTGIAIFITGLTNPDEDFTFILIIVGMCTVMPSLIGMFVHMALHYLQRNAGGQQEVHVSQAPHQNNINPNFDHARFLQDDVPPAAMRLPPSYEDVCSEIGKANYFTVFPPDYLRYSLQASSSMNRQGSVVSDQGSVVTDQLGTSTEMRGAVNTCFANEQSVLDLPPPPAYTDVVRFNEERFYTIPNHRSPV